MRFIKYNKQRYIFPRIKYITLTFVYINRKPFNPTEF